MKKSDLKKKWDELLMENPKLRIRNAAHILKVSEVELLDTQVGESVIRLEPKFNEILARIEELGYVMALTRNDDVVHERKGVYLNGQFGNHVSLFLGADIDLRMFLSSWKFAFSVTELTNDKPRLSFQFFAQNGEAVHKIYLTNKSEVNAFKEITEAFTKKVQEEPLSIQSKKPNKKELPDAEINIENFRKEWVDLKDTHDFYGVLGKYKVTRTQALRLAPVGNYAVEVNNTVIRRLLEKVSESGVEIMVFVGNQGNIQIHTGPTKKLLVHGEWYNVMDPEFNLHVNESAISNSWVVRKPTEDGLVTSIEIFNKKGEMMVQLFGKRKPGIPELQEWRSIVADVEEILRIKVSA